MGHSVYLIHSLEEIISKSNENGIGSRQAAILILEHIDSFKLQETLKEYELKTELFKAMGGKWFRIDRKAREYATMIGCKPDDIVKLLRGQECSLTSDQINSLRSISKCSMVHEREGR